MSHNSAKVKNPNPQNKQIKFDSFSSLEVKLLNYSEVPNRRADRNKRAGLEKNSILPAFLLSKLINEQSGIFGLLHEKLRAGWKENLKNLSKHALLFGTSE